jgi:hypothetical protein
MSLPHHLSPVQGLGQGWHVWSRDNQHLLMSSVAGHTQLIEGYLGVCLGGQCVDQVRMRSVCRDFACRILVVRLKPVECAGIESLGQSSPGSYTLPNGL